METHKVFTRVGRGPQSAAEGSAAAQATPLRGRNLLGDTWREDDVSCSPGAALSSSPSSSASAALSSLRLFPAPGARLVGVVVCVADGFDDGGRRTDDSSGVPTSLAGVLAGLAGSASIAASSATQSAAVGRA